MNTFYGGFMGIFILLEPRLSNPVCQPLKAELVPPVPAADGDELHLGRDDAAADGRGDLSPMKSEPPAPTRTPDSQFREM